MIYHITTQEHWQNAQVQGFYKADSLELEGFIHCSTQSQVAGVLERYYTNIKNLVKLHIEESLLHNELKWELSPSINEAFPHIYGVINLDAITNFELI